MLYPRQPFRPFNQRDTWKPNRAQIVECGSKSSEISTNSSCSTVPIAPTPFHVPVLTVLKNMLQIQWREIVWSSGQPVEIHVMDSNEEKLIRDANRMRLAPFNQYFGPSSRTPKLMFDDKRFYMYLLQPSSQ